MDKGEAEIERGDNTSTAGSKDTVSLLSVTSESKSPTANKEDPGSSPDFKGFPESPVNPSSMLSKIKRYILFITTDSTSDKEYLTNKKCIMNSDNILKKRNVQKRIKTPGSNAQLHKLIKKLTIPLKLQWSESIDKTPYLERIYGRNIDMVKALLPSSKMNPVVVLERLQLDNVTGKPLVMPFKSQLDTSRFSMNRKNSTRVKSKIMDHSGLTKIASRNSVCHRPDTRRLPHQKNMKIPHRHQPSSSSYQLLSRNATKPSPFKKICNPTGQSEARRDISSQPEWFKKFVRDYRETDMRNISKILNSYRELRDTKNEQLSLLENILGGLEEDKF